MKEKSVGAGEERGEKGQDTQVYQSGMGRVDVLRKTEVPGEGKERASRDEHVQGAMCRYGYTRSLLARGCTFGREARFSSPNVAHSYAARIHFFYEIAAAVGK